MNIMVVEDEPVLRRLYLEILREKHSVVAFDSPSKAFASFVKNPNGFDLIITDQRMTGRSGISLVYDIKTVNPKQNIVMISSWASEAEVLTKINVQIFTKPITRAELVQIVDLYGSIPA